MVNDGNDDKADLANPENYKLENTVNIYFKGYKDMNERIGGWFISPEKADYQFCKKDSCPDNIFKSPKLSKEDTVFLLLHGNAKNRGASHRIAAYKTFQRLGFYTLTIDYRELRENLGDDFKLVLYGHSMGSGIATHATVLGQEEGLRIDGVLLDSPFHSIGWTLNRSRIATFIESILGVESMLAEYDILFNSINWVKQIRVPVRILHAEVDQVVPIGQSVSLVEDSKQHGKLDIDLVRFDEEGLGHIGISTTRGFIKQIQDFADIC
ncbi:monoacylglycerol lipase ABHD12 isoform X2 [Eurytemora carolleeae]|nr:monoacylglycerol lipase ABHD12 isoform X2 [Eurytemora carolleeae]|eukprot:XP_023341853.1 monoacylglycerol lipase ABHD12-like isoform X2 [Eurytemora affinis]